MSDPRMLLPGWDPERAAPRGRTMLLVLIAVPLAVWYFGWLLQPERVGVPALYGLLVAAELFNLCQAAGFWWTISRASGVWWKVTRSRESDPSAGLGSGLAAEVDVLIPVYDEPVEIVEPTVRAAGAMRGARVKVHVLDDGRRDEIQAMAIRRGAGYIRRGHREGAKAGNLNAALEHTTAPFVAVFDCDHVPSPRFLERTLEYMRDRKMAFVQTPQYYGNSGTNQVAAAAWAQQALFFGAIARGKDGHGAIFCCGTNFLFRRAAMESVGGFPTDSVTEDFELSIKLHEHGWRSRYVPEVLAVGLGPEDMASYVSQQQRWARGCLGAVGSALRARIPIRLRVQYLLSSMYFLSGWTLLAYMAFPVIRILTGAQPVDAASADQFLVHFVPYFTVALSTVAIAGAGAYSFAGFSLAAAGFWIHVQATLRALLRRPPRFVVTPKRGAAQRQPRSVAPTLVVIAALAGAAVYGASQEYSPATLNNIGFAALHICVLSAGARLALVKHTTEAPRRAEETEPLPEPT
jgi:cellulose synthase (UDP-forming)